MTTSRSTAVPRRQWLLLVPLGLAGLYMVSGPPSREPALKVPQLTVQEAKALLDAGAVVIDVRGAEAFGHRHLPGAINIPLAMLESAIPASLAQAKSKPIVVYCNDGVRTGPKATALLQQAGYVQAANMTNGIEGWAGAGLPITK